MREKRNREREKRKFVLIGGNILLDKKSE